MHQISPANIENMLARKPKRPEIASARRHCRRPAAARIERHGGRAGSSVAEAPALGLSKQARPWLCRNAVARSSARLMRVSWHSVAAASGNLKEARRISPSWRRAGGKRRGRAAAVSERLSADKARVSEAAAVMLAHALNQDSSRR